MRIVCTYAGVKRYEGGTVGIVEKRLKSKKREGELRLLQLKDFCKVAVEISP